MRTSASITLAALALSCGAPSFPAARFANAPPTTVVDDRLDVPTAPSYRLFLPDVYFYDGSFHRLVTRALELPRPRRARGVNALDQVPDSTWFTNRIGVRDLAPAEIEAGPLTADSPERHLPWTVKSTKVGGTSFGLIVTDAQHIKYLVKFDGLADPPELETGTHVIVNRILWACGYNVAEDQIVYLRASDLVVAPDAVVKDQNGAVVGPLDRRTLEEDLRERVHVDPDGRIRALASRWIEGKVLGGPPSEGVRDDDPNDRIPHEQRRDLRGAFSIFAWLDHVDIDEGNFLDSWVTDPADAHRHYVRHYAIDFGKSLGAMAAIGYDWRRGFLYVFDVPDIFLQLVTGGLLPRPWDDRSAPALRGVSNVFEADVFDPGGWVPQNPGWIAFADADRFDKFWGATIVRRFRRDQLEAAVRAARFTDPRAAAYVVDTLIARQRKTLAYWYARVAPLDGFAVDGDASPRLCFDDLAITDGLALAPVTHYAIERYDARGASLGAAAAIAATGGRTCTAPRALAGGGDGYTIVRIAIGRDELAGSTYVHVARDPGTGSPRVIGIWRP